MAGYFALALESILVVGLIVLLKGRFKGTLPVGLNLDARLALLFSSRLGMPGSAVATRGFQTNWTATVNQLTGGLSNR